MILSDWQGLRAAIVVSLNFRIGQKRSGDLC
jgi:hypothetical protein